MFHTNFHKEGNRVDNNFNNYVYNAHLESNPVRLAQLVGFVFEFAKHR
jgi:hypothetical protein